MIGDAAGLTGWWIGFGGTLAVAFIYGVGCGVGAALRTISQSYPVAPASPGGEDGNVADPGRLNERDLWVEFDAVTARKGQCW